MLSDKGGGISAASSCDFIFVRMSKAAEARWDILAKGLQTSR
jgi:hypothetical protein